MTTTLAHMQLPFLETKLLIKSIISDAKQGAKFFSCDLKDFFIATHMAKDEYMKTQYKCFLSDIRQKYNLESKVSSDGYIYIKIKIVTHDIKQAVILAFDRSNLVRKHDNIQ